MHEATPEIRRQWLTSLARHDPRLAARLTQPTFSFTDLGRLTDDSWRLLIAEVDVDLPAAALAGAESEFAAGVIRRLPRADARRLQQAIDSLGPTRLSDLDAAQEQLVAAARELELHGRLEWLDDDQTTMTATPRIAAAA
jgi:flagellar motor switch protein FliG